MSMQRTMVSARAGVKLERIDHFLAGRRRRTFFRLSVPGADHSGFFHGENEAEQAFLAAVRNVLKDPFVRGLISPAAGDR